MVNIPQNILLV